VNTGVTISYSPSPSQWTASTLLLVAAAVHIPLIADHLEEAPYIGILFIALSVVCVALAGVILLLDTAAVWLLSASTCLAAVVAFLASRTVGLPQMSDDIGSWSKPLSFPALASEVLLVTLAVIHLAKRHAATRSPAPSTKQWPGR
jgi:hypothetical protein